MRQARVTALAGALLLALVGHAVAQPRDGALNEQRLEQAAADCRASPECARALRQDEARSRQASERAARDFERDPVGHSAKALVTIGGILALTLVPTLLLFKLMGSNKPRKRDE